MQVSVDDQDFDTRNFFALEEMEFRRDKVNFNKGWLGIFMENAEGRGILVKEITQGSPAAEAGLKVGDIITKINNEPTIGKGDLNLIRFKKAVEAIGADGAPVLTVSRDNTEMMFKPRLFGKLLKDVHEPITSLISKASSGLIKQDANIPSSSSPCEEGRESPSSNKEGKTPFNSNDTGTSFIGFAIKNEKYRDILGATLQRIGEEAYARDGFQSNEETNPFRLSIVNYFMLHPFDTPKIGQVIVDTFGNKDLCTRLECAAELLDARPDKLSITPEANSSFPHFAGGSVKDFHFTSPLFPPSQGGDEGVVNKSPNVLSGIEQTQKIEPADSLQGQLQRIIDSLVPSVSLIQEAFHDLSREEVEFLYQNAHKIWLPDVKVGTQDLARLLALSQKVDLARLFEAASLLLSKLDPICCEQGIDALKKTYLNATKMNISPFHIPANNIDGARGRKTGDLATDSLPSTGGRGLGGGTGALQDFAGDILFVQDTVIGKIVMGGAATSYYYADASVIIDLGGNDYYFNNAGSSSKDIPVAICIDLSGDDVYNTSGPFSQGTGRFGIGLLADFRGNDKYVSQDFSQGSCLFGIGVLMDNDGNDFYSGHVANQGVGFFGAGILSDLSGNDVYFSRQFAQGVGFTKGFGALIDSGGNDFYFAGGEYPDFRDPKNPFNPCLRGWGWE